MEPVKIKPGEWVNGAGNKLTAVSVKDGRVYCVYTQHGGETKVDIRIDMFLKYYKPVTQ